MSMMEISIKQLKVVIEELQNAKLEYKKQMNAFEQVYKEYQGVNQSQREQLPFKKVLKDLEDEYHSIKQLEETLAEVVACYENAEKKISGSRAGDRSHFVRPIATEQVKKILDDFKIKIF